MTALFAQISHRAKALAALVAAAAVTYVGDAIIAGRPWTVHGLEVAIASGLVTAFHVHQQANGPKPGK